MKQKEFHVTMLGPRGVGKTSILAGMYDQFEKAAKASDLGLTPDANSSARLSQKLGELKAQTKTFKASNGIAGTADAQKFIFDLGLQFGDPEMNIVFEDYPGGWFSGEDSGKSKRVEDAIRDSQMIILAIDTPALMERNGQWNETVNQPRQMSDFFKRAFRGIHSKKLVLLVPVKCESYVQDESSIKNLSSAIKQSYETLISNFKLGLLVDKVALGIAPIQTLGNVRFSHYDCHDNIPEACFIVCKNDKNPNPYSPENVEQVIFYMLDFVFSQYLVAGALDDQQDLNKNKGKVDDYMNNRSWSRRVLDTIGNVDSGKRDELESISNGLKAIDSKLSGFNKSIKKLVKKRKENKEGFEIIQGWELFSLDDEYSHDHELECEY